MRTKEANSLLQMRKNPGVRQYRKLAMTGRRKPVSRVMLMTTRAGVIFRISSIPAPGGVPGGEPKTP